MHKLPEMTDGYSAPFAPGGPSPIDTATLERLLGVALEKGGHYADLFFEYRATGSWAFEDQILKAAGRGVTMGLGVRVRVGDAVGYAYTEDLEQDAMLHAARTAGSIARAGGGHAAAPLRAAVTEGAGRYLREARFLTAPGELKRSYLERADRAARAADSRISRVQVTLAEDVREILVATSDGRFVHDRQPMIRFGVYAIAESEGKRQGGSSGGGGRVELAYLEESATTPEAHAQEAVRQALAMLDAREAPAGEMDVVLAPGDSGILLHEAVGHGLEADFNRKGTSNYSNRVGEVVASELCTVVDDATTPGSRGSIHVDDEGNLPASTVLIEKGVLRGYMQDRQSAEHFSVPSTGNGRRESFRAHPMPRMTNTLLLAGPHDPEEILRSTKRGVYARKFGGGQVDISNGDFVFSLTEGYLIEDGKLTAPLKGVNLIGNGPEAMRKVVMLGTDLRLSDGIWTCGKEGQSVPVGVGCPTLKLAGITVGGTDTRAR